MAGGSYGGWAAYVPVAKRRKEAERHLKRLRKNGHPVAPVTIEGRTIARTFWGKAWCNNLESYRDYENRLPRGRSYVRNGAVVDLQVSALEIKAIVSGSSIYNVTVTIKALAPALWRSICTDCAGGIDSLVELLQGRFSKGVMERLCRQDRGLFPKPKEIRFSCTCPDGAYMCKHVAAVLYGVGARLDERPGLLFRLRAVDENDLVTGLDKSPPLSNQPLDGGKLLETDDLSALFGLDIEEAGDAIAEHGAAPAAPARQRRRTDPDGNGPTLTPRGRKTASASRPAAADPEAGKGIALSPVVPSTTPPKRTSKSKAGKTNPGEPTKHTPPPGGSNLRAGSRGVKDTKTRKNQKPKIELTADGFVKWWE